MPAALATLPRCYGSTILTRGGVLVAKKTYIPGLQTSIDDEIANLSAAQSAQSSEAAPAQADESYPPAPTAAAAAPPAPGMPPGLPGAAPVAGAPVPKALARSRRLSPALLVVVGILAVLVVVGLGFIVLHLASGNGSPAVRVTATSAAQPTVTTSPFAAPTATASANSTPPPFYGPLFPPSSVLSVTYCLVGLLIILLLGLAVLLVIRVRSRRQPGVAGTHSDGVTLAAMDADLGLQIQRLNQIRSWVSEDPDFSHLVDSIIGKQVKASERRQQIYSVIFGAASLIAGWLLSAFTSPATHLIGH
jgi:hypothetical protein